MFEDCSKLVNIEGLQQPLPFTVLKRLILNILPGSPKALQQPLPFTVLKQRS